jgi:hypothetical protein
MRAVAVIDEHVLDAVAELLAQRHRGGLVPYRTDVHPPLDRAGPNPLTVDRRGIELSVFSSS